VEIAELKQAEPFKRRREAAQCDPVFHEPDIKEIPVGDPFEPAARRHPAITEFCHRKTEQAQ